MLYSMESQKILCDVCGTSFTKNQNRLIHMRTVHQGKRELTKREVTDKQGILACTDIRTCKDSVESNPQAEANTDKARKLGLLKRSQIGPFGSQVTRLESRES